MIGVSMVDMVLDLDELEDLQTFVGALLLLTTIYAFGMYADLVLEISLWFEPIP